MKTEDAAGSIAISSDDAQSCPLYDDLIIGELPPSIVLSRYKDETQLPAIMAIMAKDLSEPYSIFTYRFFLSGWPELCFLVRSCQYDYPITNHGGNDIAVGS